MRARILAPLLACALVAVVLTAVPLLALFAGQRTERLVSARAEVVEQIAQLAREAASGERSALEGYVRRHLEIHHEHVLVMDATGDTVFSTGGLDPGSPVMETFVRTFGATPPPSQISTIHPWSGSSALLATPIELGDDVSSVFVALQVDTTDARGDVRRAWALTAAVAAALAGVLVLTTSAWSRWVLRPVRRLDEAAAVLTTGRRPAALAQTGPRELRRLASSFDQMSGTLTRTLEQQRALVADTSHQLRNPIAAIRLRIDLLAAGAAGDGPAGDGAAGDGAGGYGSETLTLVQQDLDRLEHTVDRLLVLAELEHRVSEGEVGPAGVAEFVLIEPEQVLARWRDRASAAGVELSAAGGRARVRGDLAEEMLDAVLDNALKYAGAGAVVRLRTTPWPGGRVAVEVEDSGPGLPEQELAEVGTRFWRSSHHRDVPGTGLGLAMVDAQSRVSGGELQVGRSELGGLRVAMVLPVAQS